MVGRATEWTVLRVFRFFTCAVALASAVLLLAVGDPSDSVFWLTFILFWGWLVGAFLAAYALAAYSRVEWFTGVMLTLSTLGAAYSAVVYYDAFFVSARSTSALILLFLPIYQWAALLLVTFLCAVAGWIVNRG